MTFQIIRYLLATPFIVLWAICLTGNAWLLLAMLTHRPARQESTPIAVIGLIAGLLGALISPLIVFIAWYKLLALAALPEGVAAVVAILGLLFSHHPPTTTE